MSTEVLSEVSKIKTTLEAKTDELQKKHTEFAEASTKGREELSNELHKSVQGLQDEIKGLNEKLEIVEEKGARGASFHEKKSLADALQGKSTETFAKSDFYGFDETKTLLASDNVRPTYLPGIQLDLRQPLTVRDLIPSISVSTSSFTYMKQLAKTGGADMVAENAIKPEVNYTFDEVNDVVRKIAVWTHMTDEAIADTPQVVSVVKDLMAYDVKLKEDVQLLMGDGTGQNLNGILTQATAFDATVSAASDNNADTVLRAILQAQIGLVPIDTIVMNPADIGALSLEKDSNGNYLFGGINGTVGMIGGSRVVGSHAMPSGQFLVGSFSMGARIYDREQIMVKYGLINDDLVHNRQAVVVEERLGLAVRRPAAFVKGTFA